MAVESPQCTIQAGGHKQLVKFGGETHPLRLRETRKGLNHLTRFQVDHLDRVLCQRREERPLTLQVNREVVDSPVDIWHWDCLDKLEGKFVLRRCSGTCQQKD
jgi:hypothetical protein